MNFWQTLLTSSIPAVAAIATIYLTNKHNAKLAKDERLETRSQLLADREWDREQRAEMNQTNAEGLRADRKREAILAAVSTCGEVMGNLVDVKTAVMGGYIPDPDPKLVVELPSILYRVLLEVPSGALRQEVSFTLRSVEDAVAAVKRDIGEAQRLRAIDDAVGQLSEMSEKLVEVQSGQRLASDYNKEVPGTPDD